MTNFTNFVVILGFLVCVVFGVLAVGTVISVNNRYFQKIDYRTDPTGIYQLSYQNHVYGRAHDCDPKKISNPAAACGSAHPWMPHCMFENRLKAEHHWPLFRTGTLSFQSDDFAVFQTSSRSKPRNLVVHTNKCLVEYPRIR